jgi:hypothetical protein
MKWKHKALIQNIISILPEKLSYDLYYWTQRNFGGLKSFNPLSRMAAGAEMINRIIDMGKSPIGGRFFEVGTGRVPIVPMTYWLLGANSTITVDLNPYLKNELVNEALKFMLANRSNCESILGPNLIMNRFDSLLDFASSSNVSTNEFLDLCSIKYLAPGDASKIDLDDGVIDFHTSYTVLEHINPEIITKIFREGKRILSGNGLFVHRIDYSDHFSHSDRSISAINFLQYSDNAWAKFAGNKYMYMNRLRHDDFLEIFSDLNFDILETQPSYSSDIKRILEFKEIVLDQKFSSKATDMLSITGSWFVMTV